jgi:hypothetical protein
MATTDSRTGFRLPWSTERAASREASAVPAEELVAAAPTTGVDAGAAPALEPGETSPQDAAGDGVTGEEEEVVTILAPDAASTHAQADTRAPVSEPVGTQDAATAGEPAPAAAPSGTPNRRPNKFLADLTRAMQVAAEQARAATLDQFRSEGTVVVERIHARSATGATELRRHADDDVAAIKEWSKAEIARIREETERRVAARREQLEGQLERHAALVEHEIEKVRGRIASFEADMGQFFDDLVGEDDPAVFAARAASLPEAPSFEDLDDGAMTALLLEPGAGVPEPAAAEPVEATLEPAGEAAVDVVVEDSPAEQDAVAEEAPLDREAAMAAIQAAAEAAAALDAPETTPDAAAELIGDTPIEDTAELIGDTPAEIAADTASGVPAPDPWATAVAEAETDPRLAMLGLTSDFAAAETAAEEMAAAEIDDVPELGGAALEARLSGLVPGDAAAADQPAVTTRVVVTGLVSVASIASFKRHMGRLAGVGHVGVSSGPDSEFVFAVSHDPATSLRDLIPTLPGFVARVVGGGEGMIEVSAQDPQD